mgnify:CR=1 FL=1
MEEAIEKYKTAKHIYRWKLKTDEGVLDITFNERTNNTISRYYREDHEYEEKINKKIDGK